VAAKKAADDAAAAKKATDDVTVVKKTTAKLKASEEATDELVGPGSSPASAAGVKKAAAPRRLHPSGQATILRLLEALICDVSHAISSEVAAGNEPSVLEAGPLVETMVTGETTIPVAAHEAAARDPVVSSSPTVGTSSPRPQKAAALGFTDVDDDVMG
jgi:hypothetical protein